MALQNRMILACSTLLLALALPSVSTAATIDGTITDASGTGIVGMETRVWANTSKGYAIAYTTLTGAGGAYSFAAIPGGDYKLDARMPNGYTGTYGDTWYDVAMPTSNGRLAQDADVLTIADTDALTGMDISLPTTGALEGFITGPGPKPLVNVRVESIAEYQYHHAMLTKTEAAHLGWFSMHGLDSDDYRVIAYDSAGAYELLVTTGPHTVATSAITNVGSLPLAAMGADANEPNNLPTTANTVGALPYASTGAIITPRGSDVDWYCYTASDGDRLIATADTTVTIGGVDRPHPWLDPMIGFFSGPGTTLLVSNDDSTPGAGYDSLLDTGILTAGDYCFVVTTFGDSNWAGTGQQTAGRYGFGVTMGNRAPVLFVSTGGSPVAEAPATIATDEGVPQQFELVYSDPEGDMLVPNVTVVDGSGNPVQGSLVNNGTDGTFVWTPSQTAAVDGPYELTFTVTDGEFTQEVHVIVTPNAINVPPSVPVLDSPIANARVSVSEVPLVLQNSIDLDNDAIVYDYQVDVGTPDGVPELTTTTFEDPSGLTTWTTTTLAENSVVHWRARASDGMGVSGYSAWSGWESFFVDTMNEPPGAPVIVKPEFGEVVPVTIPRISATVPSDPENDDLVVRFEVATDVNFENIAASSTDVDATDVSMMVEWTTDPPLADGTRYYVRAQAEDVLGAVGPWSDTSEFRIPSMELPDVPGWTGDYAEVCATGRLVFDEIPASIVVANVDGSGDTVSFQFQILEEGVEGPVYDITVPQSDGATTEIPIDTSALHENGRYVFQMRTVRDEEMRDWIGCEVGIDMGDDPVVELEIISPAEKGFVFQNPDDVFILVRNPYDPDPVEQLEMRTCLSTTGDWADCSDNVQEWPQVEWHGDGDSHITLENMEEGQTWFFKVCAVRVGAPTCTMDEDTWFKVSGGSIGNEEEGCGCASTNPSDSAAPAGLLLFALFWSRRRRRKA